MTAKIIEFDLNKKIKDEIKKRYIDKCPFCGETTSIVDGGGLGSTRAIYYGKFYKIGDKGWKPFQKRRQLRQDFYFCDSCGSNWESPVYPIDIENEVEFRQIYDILFKEEDKK